MERDDDRLAERRAKNAGAGWHSFSRNLYLRVDLSPDGDRRRWICRITRGGRKRDFGCGSLADTSVALARKRRDQILKQLRDGVDPLAAKREAREAAASARKAAHTFREAAEAVMAAREGGWKKSSTSFASWMKYLFRDAKPLLRMPVADIAVDHVKAAVSPLWARGHYVAARRMLTCVELTLSYAIAHGWRTSANVAAWEIFKHIAPSRPNGGNRHHAALRWQEMPALYARLSESDGLSALALQTIILTGCRSNEIRGLRWDEVDFDAGVITIAASRMKRGAEFPVPITSPMLAILKPLHDTRGKDQMVFPGPRPGKPLANQGCWMLMQRLTDGTATTHGLRSSLRSWMGDTGVEYEVAEAMLSHAPGSSTVTAYMRSSMLERRRPALEAWGKFVSGEAPDTKIIPLTRKRS